MKLYVIAVVVLSIAAIAGVIAWAVVEFLTLD